MKPTKQAVYSSRTADKFVVRLPDGMRSQVEARAKVVYGSMNSYIIRAVENQLRNDNGGQDEAPQLEVQWMPEVNDAVWVAGGAHSARPIMAKVTAKHVIYQAGGNPGYPGNDKPNVVLDLEYLVFLGDKFKTEKLEKIALVHVKPAEL